MKFFVIIIEQALIGIGNFLVSWLALRNLASDQMAAFAAAWSVGWAVFAVLSESLITPLRVDIASSGQSSSLSQIRFVASAVGAGLAATSLPLILWRPMGEYVALGLMCLGIPLAAVAFYSTRSLDIEAGRIKSMLRRGAVYAVCSLVGLLVVSLVYPTPGLYAVTACSALLLSSIEPRAVRASPMTSRTVLASLEKSFRLSSRTIWTNRAYGLATALRVTLFSSGLIFFIGAMLGSHAVAVYAALFVLVSPVQLASSSLPWLLLSRQARKLGDPKGFRAEMFLQLSLYLGLALSGALMLAVLWGWWTSNSISDAAVRTTVQGSLIGVMILMCGILMTSWSSSLNQVLRLRNVQMSSVIVGGFSGFAAILFGASVIIAAFTPYVISLLISAVFIFLKASSIRSE